MAKAVFLSGYLTYDGNTVYLTNLDYNESWDVEEVSDLSDGVDEKSFEPTKKKMSFSAEAWKDINTGNLTAGTKANFVLDFADYQISGNGIITVSNINAVFDSAIKYIINGIVNNDITETVAS